MVDFVGLARSLGVEAYRVTEPAEHDHRAVDLAAQGEAVERGARGLARGHLLGLCLALEDVGRGRLVEAGRQLAHDAAAELGGERRVVLLVGGVALVPVVLGRGALLARVPGGADVLGDLEGRVVPA